jgi:hypothetical protein
MALGRQFVARPVEMRLEHHAVLAHLAQLGQRHDLEAARVGEDRAVPVDEPVSPPNAAMRSAPGRIIR